MKPFLVIAVLGAATACSPEDTGRESAALSDSGMSAMAGSAEASVSAATAHLISDSGIGPFQPGLSLGEFRERAADRLTRYDPYYRVDLSALCVEEDAILHVCGLVAFDEIESDTAEVRLVVTDNAAYRTAEGVGPGARVSDVVDIYGPATLYFSYNNEAREYVEFANGPENVVFRAASAEVEQFAGFYDLGAGSEYFETTTYRPGTQIGSVEVHAPTIP